MTKPFDLYELLARIEANLKRTVDNPYQNNNTLIYKNIKINNCLWLYKRSISTIYINRIEHFRIAIAIPTENIFKTKFI